MHIQYCLLISVIGRFTGSSDTVRAVLENSKRYQQLPVLTISKEVKKQLSKRSLQI